MPDEEGKALTSGEENSGTYRLERCTRGSFQSHPIIEEPAARHGGDADVIVPFEEHTGGKSNGELIFLPFGDIPIDGGARAMRQGLFVCMSIDGDIQLIPGKVMCIGQPEAQAAAIHGSKFPDTKEDGKAMLSAARPAVIRPR